MFTLNNLYSVTDIHYRERIILGYIMKKMNSEDADCIDLGYKEIHSQLGISKSVAIKSVKSLEDNNKIIKVSGVQHANNSFKLHPELLNQFI